MTGKKSDVEMHLFWNKVKSKENIHGQMSSCYCVKIRKYILRKDFSSVGRAYDS